MARHYGKKISKFFGGGGRHRRMSSRRHRYGDNPRIRHSHLEHKEINLNQEYEVRHAEEIGAIKVGKNGAVVPVRGKAYVKNGHLYYSEGALPRREHHHSRKRMRRRRGRHITEADRKIWEHNALRGTEKWHAMSHALRVERRRHPKGNWGFEGHSPRTRDRR
jgi:hypothetical protein